MDNLDEKEYLHLIQQDNSKAFESLFLRYHKRIYTFVLNLLGDASEAEEIVQNLFMAIWNQRKQLNITTTFSAYLYGIARHMVYEQMQKRIRHNAFIEYSLYQNYDFQEFTENNIEYIELKSKLEQLIEILPEKRKEIFILSRYQDLTYKEIAQKLNITENTVDTQIRHALNFLRAKLSSEQ